MVTEAKFCPSCGTPLKPGTRFCPSCGAPVRTAPVQNTPAQEAAAQSTPAQETAPAQSTPAQEEAAAQSTPAQETAAQSTPAQETPVQNTAAQEEAAAQSTPVQETPVQNTAAQGTPAQRPPVQNTAAQSTPVQETPMQRPPVQSTPAPRTPAQRPPVQNTAAPRTPAGYVPPAKSSGKKKPVLFLAGAAVVLIALVVIVFGRGGKSNPHNPDRETTLSVRETKGPKETRDPEGTAGEVSNAEEEYLAAVDQALNLYLQSQDQISDILDTIDQYGVEGVCTQSHTVVQDMKEKLKTQRARAEAVSGVDAALKTAGTEFFQMLEDHLTATGELYLFTASFIEYTMGAQSQPLIGDYSNYINYFNDVIRWMDSLATTEAGISSRNDWPSSLQNEYDRYFRSLDLYRTALQKASTAVHYSDSLRLYSAALLAQRAEIMWNVLPSIINGLDEELSFAALQASFAQDLVTEMHSYANLSRDSREGYRFENSAAGKIYLSYDVVDTVYPSLYNTYDALLIIKTGCISGTANIVVEAEIPGFTQKYKESFSLDNSYRAIYIKPPAVAGELDLRSAKSAQMSITVSDRNGALLESKSFPITIKSIYDVEWRSDEYGIAAQDNILCYVTPEAEAISELKRAAIDEISSMTGKTMESFPGYQEAPGYGPYVTTYLQAAGLMRAMYNQGVRYNMDPYSISGSNQHVLLPEDVLARKSGLCVETALTVASALQSASMHAFLIFPPGHAQVAVEVWSGQDDNGRDHTGEYFLIETTALSADNNSQKIYVDGANALLNNKATGLPIQYLSADDMAKYLTEANVTYVIDCDDASILGMTPFVH